MTKAITTTNNVLENTTKKKEFKPLPSMTVWLNKSMEIDGATIKDIAEACGMDRSCWYRWLETPGFIEWYNNQWNEKLKSYSQRLDMIGIQNARRDFNYWKAMQQRVGNLLDDKLPSQTNIQINFTRGEHERD